MIFLFIVPSITADRSCEFLVRNENLARAELNLTSRRKIFSFSPWLWCCHRPGHCRIISIWYAMSDWLGVVWKTRLCEAAGLFVLCFWNVTHQGSKATPKELWLGRGREALEILSYTFNLCGSFSLSSAGKFREKASILHKIAKKKCQVEDSEKANGVASRSGKNFYNLFVAVSRIVLHFVWETV